MAQYKIPNLIIGSGVEVVGVPADITKHVKVI